MNNSEHQQRSVFTLLFVEFSFWKLDLCVQFLLEVARQKNQTPLPLIKPYTGPRLPPDRYCLTAPNYRLKSVQKKVKTLKLLLYFRKYSDFFLLNWLFDSCYCPPGIVVCRQDIGTSPQCWRRLQQTQHTDNRWVCRPGSDFVNPVCVYRTRMFWPVFSPQELRLSSLSPLKSELRCLWLVRGSPYRSHRPLRRPPPKPVRTCFFQSETSLISGFNHPHYQAVYLFISEV